MADGLAALLERLRWLGDRLVDPLRVDDDERFRLSMPETQTTTVDGGLGWQKRPPAILECPRCGSDIHHHRSREPIDCPRCVAEFGSGEFPDLNLRYLVCPVCESRMEHGRRHPGQVDVPEWATCNECRYHWEYDHFF